MAILTPRSGTLRYRRRGLLLAVGLVVPFYPLDLLLGHACAASLCYELIWMAVLVAGALLQSYRTHRAADLAARLCGLATGFLFSLIVAATGNSNSPYFFYSLALPFSALVLLPDIPSAAALTTIGTLGGGVSIMLREGRGWRYVAVWSYLGLAACLLAALGAWLYSRVWQAKARAQRERLATALAAAKSERCRKRDVAIAYAQAMQSRDGLRKVLQSISDAVVVSRLDGSVTFVNGAGQRMLGIIPGSPITTRSVLDRVVPEDRAILLRRREAFAAGRNPEPSIVRVPGTSGLRECEISGVCVEFDGAPAIATVVRDITERRDMDRRLALAERMSSIGTLASGVAHEINNPLSCVLSNLRFLSGELDAIGTDEPERLAEARAVVHEAIEGADRVRRIVRNLQDFASPSEKPGPLDVRKALQLAISIASREIRPHARLVEDYGEVPPVHGDQGRLSQLVVALLINAAQAIAAGHPKDNEIRIATRTDTAGRALIEVRDSGCGIQPEIRNRIFEPFFTTKPVGAGIGLSLSICQGIVTSLGGEISVESEIGKGSVFRIALPNAGARPAAMAESVA